jgi:acyl-CoA-binding protein
MSKEIEEGFQFAVYQIRNAKPNANGGPSNIDKLKIYGLYKQATIGPCNESRPWSIQIEACAKWDAWNALRKMTKETAKLKYFETYSTMSSMYE